MLVSPQFAHEYVIAEKEDNDLCRYQPHVVAPDAGVRDIGDDQGDEEDQEIHLSGPKAAFSSRKPEGEYSEQGYGRERNVIDQSCTYPYPGRAVCGTEVNDKGNDEIKHNAQNRVQPFFHKDQSEEDDDYSAKGEQGNCCV